MERDKITFKKRRTNYKNGGKAVGVSETVYEKLKELADETGLTMSEIATDLITFALERVELTD